MTVLIIGGGNMGSTFAESFLSAHVIRPNQLLILEINEARAAHLKQKERGIIKTKVGNYISDVDLIVLAVKPQNANEVYPSIRPFLKPNQLVLSIMAGVRLQSLEAGLGIKKIIRAMPNLPAQVGMGMTAFTAQDDVNKHELIEVQNLLSTTGRAIYFDNEEMIDAATAISGSGPAYVFYFMNAMIKTAMELGFNESQSELLVWQTFTGAMYLHNKNNLSCSEWINRVSSKGGTTEAAVNIFKETAVETHINQGLKAAFKRAVELGS
ncbi:MAG: pyrroline-5-carboxylate reductase [Chitinophagales bacterium]